MPRIPRAVGVMLVLVLVAAGCSRQQRPSLRIAGVLHSVAAVSARDAWAVGRAGAEGCGCGRALILHWNGAAWSRVPSPVPAGRIASLSAVAFAAADDGWAVGGVGDRPLVLRWNGAHWHRVPGPTTPDEVSLNAVTATSAGGAWAVGSAANLVNSRTLILRWTGTRWRQIPSPTPPGGGTLSAVTVASATSAWAVGSSRHGALIEHWNGRTWNLIRGPASSRLEGVAAVSAASAWAVGYNYGHGGKTVILRLTSTTWKRVPSPSPSGDCFGAVLSSVVATPAGAWAVGAYSCAPRTLLLHWNGTAWKQEFSPTPSGSNFLEAVDTTPAGGVLAVGSAHGGSGTIFIERRYGMGWFFFPRR